MAEEDTSQVETIRTVDWHEAIMSIGTIEPGEVVTGFETLEELDTFANNVGLFLRGRSPALVLPDTHLTSRGRHGYIGWHDGSKPPSQVMRPKSFMGNLRI